VSRTRKQTITLAEAEALFEGARCDFESLVERIERIVATQAWKVLGYKSFAAAWRVHFGDVVLETPMAKKLVIAQLLSDGLSPDEVALSVSGVGPATVRRVADVLSEGVPLDAISLQGKRSTLVPTDDRAVVSEHYRKKPGAATKVSVNLGAKKHALLRRQAGSLGQTTQQFILDAIDERLALVARGERTAA
jgi:hypothetical protein